MQASDFRHTEPRAEHMHALYVPKLSAPIVLKFLRNNILIPNSDGPYVGSELTNYCCFIRFSCLFDLL